MDLAELMAPWVDEGPIGGEEEWTPWGKGWHAWTRTSAEVEFVEFVGSLTSLLQPSLVIETGVGCGYSTRRILKGLGEKGCWIGYESHPELRSVLSSLSWPSHSSLSEFPTPSATEMAYADFVLLDSDMDYRIAELDLWKEHGKPSSILLVHDVSGRHEPSPRNDAVHRRLFSHLQDWGGIFLTNPRGSWMGQHG